MYNMITLIHMYLVYVVGQAGCARACFAGSYRHDVLGEGWREDRPGPVNVDILAIDWQ